MKNLDKTMISLMEEFDKNGISEFDNIKQFIAFKHCSPIVQNLLREIKLDLLNNEVYQDNLFKQEAKNIYREESKQNGTYYK